MKYAVVTGASTGIGRAIAIALSEDNFHVFLIGRNIINLNKTLELINSNNAEILTCNLALPDEVNLLTETIRSKTKHIDAIINVAGVWHGKKTVYANMDLELFDLKTVLNTYNVGLTAPTILVKNLVNIMPENSNVINISGTFENGAKGWLPYFVSKKAIEALTIALSQELSIKNIRVNGISPSDTATEQYKKFFTQYIDEAVSPEEIVSKVMAIINDKYQSGTIRVIKKYNYTEHDKKFVLKAIEKAKESFEHGVFSAGALVVQNNKIISENIGSLYPKINHHPESKSIDEAMDKINDQLSDCTLYTSMEPCLMCLSKAYWAGIRRIVFALKKESTNTAHYESPLNHYGLMELFNQKIEFVHIEELEVLSKNLVKKWEEKYMN